MADPQPPAPLDPANDPLIGRQVGSYMVSEKLGEGGMGAVYRGIQPSIGKRVAIKFLSAQLNAIPEVVARFFDEAKAVNVIGHESIVDIFDFGRTTDGQSYFVMELLEGPSLEALLREEGSLAPVRAVDVARQVAGALAAAHARGIIHRDLKPDNVFLVRRAGRQDFVKILDFGIAKLAAPDGTDGGRRTKSGMILGTPGYMAPEQASGDSIDVRTDVYALGVMLYRMLVGHIPFAGNNFVEILRRQLTEDAQPIGEVRSDLSPELGELVSRMLRRPPEERPQTMEEVEATLGEIATRPLSDEAMPLSGLRITLGDPTDKVSAIDGEPLFRTRRTSKAVPIGIVAAVLTVAAAGLVLVRSGRAPKADTSLGSMPAKVDSPKQAPPAAPTASPLPPTAAAPNPAAPVVTEPKTFKLHVETFPPGAEVSDGRRHLGVTPADLELEAAGPLVFRLPGHQEQRVEAHRNDGAIRVVLRRSRATAPRPAAPVRLPHIAVPDEPRPKKGGISLDD